MRKTEQNFHEWTGKVQWCWIIFFFLPQDWPTQIDRTLAPWYIFRLNSNTVLTSWDHQTWFVIQWNPQNWFEFGLTEEGKWLLVRVIGRFKKLRVLHYMFLWILHSMHMHTQKIASGCVIWNCHLSTTAGSTIPKVAVVEKFDFAIALNFCKVFLIFNI